MSVLSSTDIVPDLQTTDVIADQQQRQSDQSLILVCPFLELLCERLAVGADNGSVLVRTPADAPVRMRYTGQCG